MVDAHNLETAVATALFGSTATVLACRAYLATGGDGPLSGNDEDFWSPNTRMWFVPGEDGGYGRVFLGFDDGYPQGGMKQAGLVFEVDVALRLDDVGEVEGADVRESFNRQAFYRRIR